MKILANIKDIPKIPTHTEIDNILGGGIEKGVITQFFGSPGSGKTNLALKLAVEVAKNGKKVAYIDTEGGISIERIQQIADSYFDIVSNNIIVFEPCTFVEQEDDLTIIESWIKSNNENIDLIILDSAVALYRLTEGNSSKLNKDLGKQMGLLSRIARKYEIAVVLTNQIYSAFDDEGNGSIKAVGGTILQYWSKIIIQLEKGDVISQRIATLKRHRSLSEGKTAKFTITNKGIE